MRILLFILLLTPGVAFSQQFNVDVTATTQSPGLNDQFTLKYTLKLINGSLTNPKITVTVPKFTNFKVISQNEGAARGGFGGFGSGIAIYEYKVVLQSIKKGSFEIDPVTFNVNNKGISSVAVPINVGEASSNPAKANGGNSNIFAVIELSSTKVHMGEPVVATYKVFSRYYSESSNDYSFPKPKDLWVEELKSGKQGWPGSTERINNTNYKVYTIKKELLYPQRSGSVKVPAFDMSLVVQTSFWDPGERINITSNAPTLTVSPLPEPKPANFNGLVGEFRLETTLTNTEVKTDDAVDLYVKIAGRGNLNSLTAPGINLPKGFDLLGEPEVKDNTTVSAAGISGSKEYNYIIVPRIKGRHELPPVELSYFDTKTKTYKTLTGSPYTIEVAQGEKSTYSTKTLNGSANDVTLLNEDIRYIKQETVLRKSAQHFFGSSAFYTLIGTPFFFLLVVFLFKQKREKTLADKNYQQQVALRQAVDKIKEAEPLAGIEALTRLTSGMYTYLSVCFNLPFSDLNKESLSQKMSEIKISESVRKELLDTIDRVEMAKYGGTASGNTTELINSVLNVLKKIEHGS